MRYMLYILSVILLLSSCSEDSNVLKPKAMSKVPSAEVHSELLRKMDSLRALSQLEAIENSTLLRKLSYRHSLYMLEIGEISHDNFEEERLPEISDSLNVHLAYENVGFYNGTENPAEKIFADWMKDTEIKSNLLKIWDRMGMAVVTDSLGNYYTTQIFITLQ